MTTEASATSRAPIIHALKIWPTEFGEVVSGAKCHEVRRFDRDFRRGDDLLLQEWAPETERYTGRKVLVRVLAITQPGTFGLPHDVGVMTIMLRTATSGATTW